MNTEMKNLLWTAKKFLSENEIWQQQWLLGLVQDSLLEYNERQKDFYLHPDSKMILLFCKACLIRNSLDSDFTAVKMIELWKSVGIEYYGEYTDYEKIFSPAYVVIDYIRVFKSRGYMELLTRDIALDLETMLAKFVNECQRKRDLEELEDLKELPF